MITWIFWLIVMLTALIIEALTINMTTIWFAIGALVALVLNLLGMSEAVQIAAMMIVSSVCFVIFLVVVKPRLNRRRRATSPTNADRIIGMDGIVIKKIDPIQAQGQIRVLGQVWSAVTENGACVEADTMVTVIGLKGVHAVVALKE